MIHRNMAQCSDVYFWRQSLILFSDYLHCFGAGFFLSFPAVLNPAILAVNSTDLRATPEQASWIAGSQAITGVIGFLVMPPIMQVFGRKAAHYGINISVAVGFIVFYFASNITWLYVARLIQGLALSGVYVTSVIIAEYSAPKRRGYFISIKKSGTAFGSLVCHWLSVVFTWREIALVGASTNILSIIITIFWPESPAHLAKEGKFEQCDKSYTWLNGESAQVMRELEELISAQTERRRKKQEGCIVRIIWNHVTAKDFRMPLLITTVLTIVVESSGRYYNLAYIVQIMTNLVKDNSVGIYCSLGSDIVTLVALWCSCFVITNFKRRTVSLSCGSVSVTLMALISLATFLTNRNYIGGYLAWAAPCLIVINSFITNLGLLPMCFTISGEIFPLEHRGLGTCVTGVVFTMIYGVVLKFTPLLMDTAGVEGIYGVYGLCLLICLIILYFILIETKDKTLQEIENEVKGIDVSNEIFLK